MISFVRDTALRNRRLFAAMLAAAAWGCGQLYPNSIFGRGAQPAPVPAAVSTPSVAPRSVEPVETTKPPPSRQTTKQPVAPAPILSLAPTGDAPTGERAQRDVDAAARLLAAVDQSKLSGRSATDYRLVAGFIEDARRALREQDFVKAEGLANKASTLASRLPGRTGSAANAATKAEGQ